MKESREGFCRKKKGKVISRRGDEDRKGAGTNSGNSDTSNLKPEIIKSTAESTRGFCHDFNCFKCAGAFIFNLKYIFSQEL